MPGENDSSVVVVHRMQSTLGRLKQEGLLRMGHNTAHLLIPVRPFQQRARHPVALRVLLVWIHSLQITDPVKATLMCICKLYFHDIQVRFLFCCPGTVFLPILL